MAESAFNIGDIQRQIKGLSDQIGILENIFDAKRIVSSSDKTTHEINVPNDTLHFLIFGATSYGLHGFGIVATTSGGAVNAETMQLEGITITTPTGKIVCNIGSTARPMIVIDIKLRGSGWCSLS